MEYYYSKPKLADLEKRINDATRRCKKKEIRNFRILIAQIRVMEWNAIEAIQISEELVEDEPEDFMVNQRISQNDDVLVLNYLKQSI